MENAGIRTVVITGGASGIGLATARKAAAAGWRPYLIDLSQENLDAACSELGHAGARRIFCDVTNEGAVENAIREAAEGHGLKAVVNCAGIGMDKPTIETEVSEFRRILDINLLGSFIVARAAARHWLDRRQIGAIVNISSVSGLCGNKGRVAYGASKGGVNLMTLVMATELGGRGIRVNAVAPGPIDTPLSVRSTPRTCAGNGTHACRKVATEHRKRSRMLSVSSFPTLRAMSTGRFSRWTAGSSMRGWRFERYCRVGVLVPDRHLCSACFEARPLGSHLSMRTDGASLPHAEVRA